jgi:hypothetical protein
MKSFSIAFFALVLLALVGCSNAEQIVPVEQAAAEAEVVSGDWVVNVFIETVDGAEVLHSKAIPNTADYWFQLEEGGEYFPNMEAIKAYLGPKTEWASTYREEDVISIGMTFEDQAASSDQAAKTDYLSVPMWMLEVAAEACAAPAPYILGETPNGNQWQSLFPCNMPNSPVPGWCIFHAGAFRFMVTRCNGVW